MDRHTIREVYNRAIAGTAFAHDVITLVNHLVSVEWDNGCLGAELDALKEAVRAEGYSIKGSTFEPELVQRVHPA